jgi:hypothetical protein
MLVNMQTMDMFGRQKFQMSFDSWNIHRYISFVLQCPTLRPPPRSSAHRAVHVIILTIAYWTQEKDVDEKGNQNQEQNLCRVKGYCHFIS